MNKMQEQLREWHQKFSVVVNDNPTLVDQKTQTLRKRLIQEESEELFKGIDENNMVEIADGLADVLYVVFGTAVSYGIDIERVFDEVHRSNMSKLWPDGKPHYDEFGKVVKPSTYSRADVESVLEELEPDIGDEAS